MAFTLFKRWRIANAITAICLLVTKLLRVYAQSDALPQLEPLIWWPFLVAQDTGVLLVLRGLADVAPNVVHVLSAVIFILASVSASFHLYTGAELQWKDYKLASNPAYWRMMLSGSATLAMTMITLLALAYLCKSACCTYTDVTFSMIRKRTSFSRNKIQDEKYATRNMDLDAWPKTSTRITRRIIRIFLAWQIGCTIFQFGTSLSTNLSWSLPVLVVAQLLDFKSIKLVRSMYKTALSTPVPFPWLPAHPQAGFNDWYTSQDHYNAGLDVLRASSLDLELLPALRQTNLKKISIRNVLLLTLEATRKDVFPLDPHGSTVRNLANSFEHNIIPPNVSERLSSLTPFANYLTSGSENSDWPARGRLNAQQAFTASTYTLKSLTGTVCGIAPIAADFNLEHSHNIYQPCLPHMLSVLNNLSASRQWGSKFMQSTTMSYDNQDKLLPEMGFQDVIGAEYLREQHKFPAVEIEDVNYFGMPEEALEQYIRDAFVTARERNESLFLSHLTSTTHHGFGVPETADSTPLSGSSKGDLLSDYLNAIGYVDGWLGRIMTILQEEGAFDKTLIIAVGDHGLALAEHGHITTYRDPHVATLHVPLVISLPGLPNIDINDTVTSLQILPTILDLLIETDSLSDEQSEAARDLLHNSEGQSLLRVSPSDSGHWHFHVTNPGGISVTVRDSRRPDWRLAVPRVDDEPWRFVDLGQDPWEMKPIRAMSSKALIARVALYNVTLPMEWLDEAADVTQWWVQENYRRWRYEG